MSACQHCGADNDDTRIFCSKCGTRLAGAAAPSAPSGAADKPAAGDRLAAAPLPAVRLPKAPLPQAPLPAAPLPAAPLPKAPLPKAPLPKAPLPKAPLPKAPLPAAPLLKAPLPKAPSAGAMRACQDCGTDNDDTRIFCGNCGMRLPEAAAPSAPSGAADKPAAGAGLAAPPLPGVPYKRPSRKSKQASRPAPAERGATGFLVFSLFWLLVISATLACVIQMVRAPDNIPDVLGIDTAAAHETFSTLKELVASPKPISWTVNSKAINQFLESTIEMKPVDARMSAMSARFQRAFVKLDKGSFALCIDQKFFDAHLYFVLDLEPQGTGAGLGVKTIGGAIGRMPLHPALMPVFLRLFEPTVAGLYQPLGFLKKAKSATITPEAATIQWPGTGNTL